MSINNLLQWTKNSWYMPAIKVHYVKQMFPNKVRLLPPNGPMLEVADEHMEFHKREYGFISYMKAQPNKGDPFRSDRILNYIDFPSKEYIPTHYLIFELDMVSTFGADIISGPDGVECFVIEADDLMLAKLRYDKRPRTMDDIFNSYFIQGTGPWSYKGFWGDYGRFYRPDPPRPGTTKAIPVRRVIEAGVETGEEYLDLPENEAKKKKDKEILEYKYYRQSQRDWIHINNEFTRKQGFRNDIC